MRAFILHSWAYLIYLFYVVSHHCGLLTAHDVSSLWLSAFISAFSFSSVVSLLSSLINKLFPLCFYYLFPLSVSLSLTLHFHFSTSPLFTLFQQLRHPMNNSKTLQDDNGKLEVRLCVACECAGLVDSFQPGGNSKRLFIHINYVNKVTLLFKVAK